MSSYHKVPWRTGRKVFRTIYATQDDRQARDSDPLIGVMDTPAAAREAVAAHNARLSIESSRQSVYDFDKTAELARAAFALQELRYLAWTALKAWDNMSLRKAQQNGPTGVAMEALRANLPTMTGSEG